MNMQIYLIFAVLLWWAIGWIKRYLIKFKCPELVQEIIILILAVAGGAGLALTFNLDLFVMLGVHDAPTEAGLVFGALGIASGSGGVYELIESIKNIRVGEGGAEPQAPDVE